LDSYRKLEILGTAAKYDICQSSYSRRGKRRGQIGSVTPSGLCHSILPDGRTVCLLKVLYSNKCVHDCRYCMNSTSIKGEKRILKTEFKSDELARLFLNFYIRNYVEGLFLSSAVCCDLERTMEGMIETARILRDKYKYNGYIHLKILPGTPYSMIKEAALLADRISLNLEAPNKSRFSELSSTKDYKIDMLRRLAWIKGFKNRSRYENEPRKYIPAGFTTQYVIGAARESDKEIIKMTNWCYEKLNLNRNYYSAFSPIDGSPFENLEPTPRLREHRLYQCDWLLRIYKYKIDELYFDENGNLPLNKDPKIYSAIMYNSELFPLEINEASYEELLKVPGIGPIAAKRIMRYIKDSRKKITKYKELKDMGVVLKRAKPFIKVNGKVQSTLDNFIIK